MMIIYADIVVLQYGVKIFVITSFKDTCYIEILPNVEKSKRGSLLTLNIWIHICFIDY